MRLIAEALLASLFLILWCGQIHCCQPWTKSSEIKCTIANGTDPCGNGKCSNGSCACSTGFISRGTEACNYKQRDKTTAFLLSMFLGWTGADWYYLAQGSGGLFYFFLNFVFPNSGVTWVK